MLGCANFSPQTIPQPDRVATAAVATPPVERPEIEVLVDEDVANLPTAVFTGTDGLLRVIYLRVPTDASRFDLYELSLTRAGGWSEPRRLELGEKPYYGPASVAALPGGRYLYFLESGSLREPANLFRSKLDNTRWGPPQRVAEGLELTILSFPRIHALPLGGVAIVFRDGQSYSALQAGETESGTASLPTTGTWKELRVTTPGTPRLNTNHHWHARE